MGFDLIVRGGEVVTRNGVLHVDVGIEGELISALEPDLTSSAECIEIDAGGLTVFPGMVDAHVHFNDPGRDSWEGGATGSAALAAGGGTTFVDMPLNSSPPTLDGSSFDAKVAALTGRSYTDFALYGGLTPVNLGSMRELAERGVVGFKAFMAPSGIDDFQYADDDTLVRGMEIAAELDLPVLLHAESAPILAPRAAALAAKKGASEEEAIRGFLESRPIIAEVEAITRALGFAEATGCSVHIVHVSNARGVALVREAAASGRVDASCETCPHYLYLNEANAVRLGARAKCAPPLRSEVERLTLLAAVKNGDVDTIGSDHSPAPWSMKNGAYLDAWGGIAGVQSLLAILLTLELDPPAIAELASRAPAARMSLPRKGAITVGNDADLTIVDRSVVTALTTDHLRDRHRLSPYVGEKLRGAVRSVLLRGKEIGESPRGRLIVADR